PFESNSRTACPPTAPTGPSGPSCRGPDRVEIFLPRPASLTRVWSMYSRAMYRLSTSHEAIEAIEQKETERTKCGGRRSTRHSFLLRFLRFLLFKPLG